MNAKDSAINKLNKIVKPKPKGINEFIRLITLKPTNI